MFLFWADGTAVLIKWWRSGAIHKNLLVNSYEHIIEHIIGAYYSPDLEYLAAKCKPFKMVREFCSIPI